jgi:hypothetical protein
VYSFPTLAKPLCLQFTSQMEVSGKAPMKKGVFAATDAFYTVLH